MKISIIYTSSISLINSNNQVKKTVVHNQDVVAKEEEDIAKGMCFCFHVYLA